MDIPIIKKFIYNIKNGADQEENEYNYQSPSVQSNSNTKRPVLIEENLIKKCLKMYEIFYKTCYLRYGNCDEHSPLVFILGQKDNVIVDAEFLKNRGGCGIMTTLTTNEISKSLYKLTLKKLFPAGLLRIGFFEKLSLNNNDSKYIFGTGLEKLESLGNKQGLLLLSIGNFGLQVTILSSQSTNNYGFKIIRKGGKNHGSNQSNTSSTRRATNRITNQTRNDNRRISRSTRY